MVNRVKRRDFLGVMPVLAWSFPIRAASATDETDVMVLPVLHGLHKNNRLYGYDDIYRTVETFQPDHVGVEIRPEDLALGDAYLADNYPNEMVHLARHYGSRTFGFDWLGDDLAGRPVPDDWWSKHSRIKQLERALDKSPLTNTARDRELNARVDALSAEQESIAKASTAVQLAGGPYDRVTAQYYKELEELTRGTPYAELSRFYSTRDAHLAANVIQHIRMHPAARVAVVTGADHHGPMVEALASVRGLHVVPVV